MLNETGAIMAISPSPAACGGDEFRAERAFRLLRIRISHPLTEEHQPVLLLTSSASDPWLRDSNTSFNRLAPLAAVSSPPTSHFLLLQLLGFVTEEPLVPRSVISAAWSFWLVGASPELRRQSGRTVRAPRNRRQRRHPRRHVAWPHC